ncbi:hypothetical protein EYF80_053615 [Liparis tanakae]|uniref:Uncharacterized protein n=1 Tax=Liparis tanakae TaxID=230148 RepID=A0A4Z2F639_9TELE|nr:hypothetical protein EYF80_053615 [Liparis tanakae]
MFHRQYPVKAFLGRLRALRVQVNSPRVSMSARDPSEERAPRPGGAARLHSEGEDPDGRKVTEQERAGHRAHVEACQVRRGRARTARLGRRVAMEEGGGGEEASSPRPAAFSGVNIALLSGDEVEASRT